MEDIHRHSVDAVLEKTPAYLAEILNLIPELVVRLDLDYTIEWANKAMLDLDSKAIGKKCFEVFQASELGCLQCPCVRAIREGAVSEGIVPKEAEGSEGEFWIKRAEAVRDQAGAVTGAVVIAKTLKQKQKTGSEDQLENWIAELDQDKQKAVHRENKNRTLFYEMVESLKDIFEIINNDIDRLRVIELYRDERDTIERLMNQSDKAYRKISNLHEIYAIEEGQLVFNIEPFLLTDFVDDLYHRFRFLSKKRNLDFSIQVDDNLPSELIGDPLRLGNIVRNLLENAFEHTEHGGVLVQITKISIIEDKLKLRISVKDTGIGFSEEKLEWLKRLSDNPQPEDILSSLGDSTGLGYVTALTLLSKMGGRLEIESAYGRGSEINIYVYAQFNGSGISNENLQFDNQKLTEPYITETARRKRILIAEDDVMGRVSLKLLLQDEFDLDFARTGRDAVERYSRHKPDLVLMDIMMPHMNGFEAYDEIEKLDRFRCPIIAVSAKVIDSERDYLTSYGFDEHLPKPIEESSLKKVLDRFFK
ncbi:response regulator [Acidaminobacter hydrogenoformans]|uniref:Stage 0 sporulation protein A homolog n=1 Tax=Acidaminobacter hydrogenoformans DSM 2784 TaxID=1120920 RepID=A0A1G5RT68_9FIRM|nr:response regulator [Acidaminobacter hydrogenoformans]SCZ76641.1 Signal transduction histidine kinase [Acidaminobacter hydrogenoformans DSM 2784]